MANSATVDDVREVYDLAYKLGAKGVTIYRDGCKQFQVLNLGDKKVEQKEEKKEDPKKKRHMMGNGEQSMYYEIQTGHGPLHVHINYNEEGPVKIFCNIGPTGTEISGLTTALGIMISKYFQEGGDPVSLLKHLNSIKGDKSFGLGPKRVDSIPHGISIAMRDHLIKTGKIHVLNSPQTILKEGKPEKSDYVKQDFKPEAKMHCPKCFSTNVEVGSGCSEPTCFDCGYSKCS